MRIATLTLQNFRCFGPKPTTVNLTDLTAFVGTNGCGKSAVLQALARLFGVSNDERTLEREDFHVPPGKTLEDLGETSLILEARLEFPELDEEKKTDAVSGCFAHMAVNRPKGGPFCRIRLEGGWVPSSLPDGDIDQNLYWITTGDEEIADDERQAVRPADRSRIQVYYVPAARDPVRQLRQVSGSILHQMLRAVQWSEKVKKSIEESSDELADNFATEDGVQIIQTALGDNWRNLFPASAYSEVNLRPTTKRLAEIIKHVEAVFAPAPGGDEYELHRLSDGMKSLFYLAIVGALFDVGHSDDADDAHIDDTGSTEPPAASGKAALDLDELGRPALTVFAIEEPENHLAPHYLGRIMQMLRKVSDNICGQVVLTSHSASIMSRVEPEEVRYLRLDEAAGTASVTGITLPDEKDEAYTFVREAVRAHPELYFARLVVLGEGASEEVVIPRLAAAWDLPIDPSFVSMVPLGGRHVNHLWRLLNQLGIPHVTLLDLDRERQGGGWGRIKYALKQLLQIGCDRKRLLRIEKGVLSDADLDGMDDWDVKDMETMKGWLKALEPYNVFFSAPLDLDYLMLRRFPDAYKETADGEPRIPEGDKYAAALAAVLEAVLKESNTGGVTYDDNQKTMFFWYRYLFLSRSKPNTHMLALSGMDTKDLKEGTPPTLKRLIARMKEQLAVASEREDDAG